MIALAALLVLAPGEGPPPGVHPAVVAYHDCVVKRADEAEARTGGTAASPTPELVFEGAEAKCQPLYAPALDAFYATTMKTPAVQAYVQGRDAAEVKVEVEAGLRDSLRDVVLQNIAAHRAQLAKDSHAQN